MTPWQQQQLELLLREQRRLEEEVDAQGARLQRFFAELEPEPEPKERGRPAPEVAVSEPRPVAVMEKVPEIPPPVPPAEVLGGGPPPLPEGPPPLPPPLPARDPQSLEMTLGTVWLARIGIVILLTGLVFLGNYAWQHIVPHLGPGGKVALLYLAAAALGGVGVWLERRPASTGRYPQVLMAGGAATAYYTTYAAHFVYPLRVIESPLIGGVLLLAVAGIFIWWSDRRKFQTAALLAIALSYYTSAINPIGEFTLFSSLLLTAAAGFFLVRHGWALVSWISLAGTYASYAFWRFHSDFATHGLRVLPPWDLGLWLLATYWVVFTGSVFLAPPTALCSARRTTFLTLNNALFFALATQHLLVRNPHGYWAFALGFGVVLLALAAVARQRRSEDFTLDGAYLTQGLAAVTAGLAMKLTGPSLAITLAVESAVLLSAVSRRHGAIYRIAAVSVAVWAFFLTVDAMNSSPELMLPLGGTVAALLLFDAWWLKQRSGWLPAMTFSKRAAGFAGLGLVLVGMLIVDEVHVPWKSTAFAAAALLATASLYLLRLPEVVVLGQFFLLAGVGSWLQETVAAPPWWNPLPIIAAALALAHWWQRQRTIVVPISEALQVESAAAVIGVGYYWMQLHWHGEAWLVGTALAGAATMAYGYATRFWPVAALGQFFALASVVAFIDRHSSFPWYLALLPVAGVAFAGAVLARGDAERWPPGMRAPLSPVSVVYAVLTGLLITRWVFVYIPAYWQLLFFAGLGALLVIAGARWPSRGRSYFGVAFCALAFLVFWVRTDPVPAWPDLLAFLLVPASLRVARLLGTSPLLAEPWPNAVVAVTTGTVWLWVTRWMYRSGNADLLTLAWSALAVAVFVAGLTLRDRIYRLGGFLILALAIGRIFLVDVWRLETIYRILSFLGLGVVLLALGFVYNRYAEKIRRWL